MDATLVISVLGVVVAFSTVAVTISLFIISGIKEDIKSHASSTSKSSTALWEAMNKVKGEFSEYKEHIAMNYPQEKRVNEKLEVNKQFLNQALSGISHRLTKLESDSDKTLRAVETMSASQKADMRSVITALESIKDRKANEPNT